MTAVLTDAPALTVPPSAKRRVAIPGWVPNVAGAAVLAVLVWRLGAGPFADGVRRVDATAVAAAVALGAATTVLSAWRWRLVAAALGADLPLRAAVAHCYRSIFLNSTLPCGVLGDVHRAVSHGRDSGDVGRGVRAVAWERTAGQVVQAVASLVLLSLLPSPVRHWMPAAVVAVLAGLAAVLLAAYRFRVVAADLRRVLRRGTWPGVAAASLLVVAGHVATFVLAARTTGTGASLAVLVPLALLALLAMGIPANVGGFGPREGMAAWSFGAAGLGAAQGVAAGTAYGVLVLAAALPGLFVLLAGRRSGRIGGVVHA